MRHIKSHFVAICGYCLEPASKHGFTQSKTRRGTYIVASYGPGQFDQVYCSRLPEDIGFMDYQDQDTGQIVADFFTVDDNDVVLVPDASGTEIDITPRTNATTLNDKGVEVAWDYDKHYRFGVPQGDVLPNGDYQDEQWYVSPDIEEAILDRWHDTAFLYSEAGETEWICTPTLEQHRSPQMGTATEVVISKQGVKPYSRTATINDQVSKRTTEYLPGYEVFGAMLGVRVFDELLREKYHNHRINLYHDKKSGDLRVGSIRITANVDGTLSANCVQNSCSGRHTFDPRTATREEAEQIVWAIISHGNNHAARWLKTRKLEDKHVIYFTLDGKEWAFNQKEPVSTPEHYTLHHPGCDATGTCLIKGHCSYRGKAPSTLATEDEQYRFLVEHQRYCKDVKHCKCEQRMAELRPDLHPELAALMRHVEAVKLLNTAAS